MPHVQHQVKTNMHHSQNVWQCHRKNAFVNTHAGADFTSDNSTVEIPSYSEFFDLPEFFRVLDDNIDEMRQSFAIIVEIGPDVPDYPTNFSCFRTFVHGRTCHGRRGAAQIRINDNDGD